MRIYDLIRTHKKVALKLLSRQKKSNLLKVVIVSFFLLKVKTHPDPDMRQLKPGTPWGEPPEASVSYPRGFRLSEPLPMVIAVLWMVCKLVGIR